MDNKITKNSNDYIATHKYPIWRDRTNLIISILLGQNRGKNEWEQLWAEQMSENTAKLCCIPFFAYDMSLGDIIEFDENYNVIRVLVSSGSFTFRVWFHTQVEIERKEIYDNFVKFGCLLEWSSINLLAINIKAEDAQKLADYLQECMNSGYIEYETGRMSK